MAEEAMLRLPKPLRGDRETRPDSRALAQDFLIKAGHTADDLSRMDPLLKEAEDNVQKRESPWRR
jgi:hypothetical protein